MRADKPQFIAINFCVSLMYAAILVLLVGSLPAWAAILFFVWVLHARAAKARAREINARLKMNSAMIAEFLEKVPGFNMDEFLEDYGLDENDFEDV